jgi:HIT zinc finger
MARSSPITASSDAGLSISTTRSPQCEICSSTVAVYTCPRCATRTCSLPCSAAHKTRTGCSGARDRAKYIPVNRYTYGTMMDDYVFLEDVGRRVGEWGQDIVRGGYGTLQGRRGRGGGGQGKTRDRTSRKKRDVLKLQLELRDIEVDLLPAGMQKRMLNQSSWDPKCVDFTSLGATTMTHTVTRYSLLL